MEKVIIGIDLGGTNLRIGAVAKDNHLENFSKISSAVIADAEKPIEKICEIIKEYKEKNHLEQLEAISIGVPSSVENDKETIICTTNIRNRDGKVVFQNINIARELRDYFKVPVFVNNDVNNILLYDIAANHLENQKIVVGIYIGTGVGAAVSIDGQLLEGKNGAELDLGHIPYYGGDEKCSCGKEGCCECYASGWKLQKIRREYYPEDKIQDLFIKHSEEQPLREFIRGCANVYAIMATIFNPDSIIVGGGVPEMEAFPRRQFEKAVNAGTGADVMSYGFDYVYSRDDAGKGVIGAAIFARRRMEEMAKSLA